MQPAEVVAALESALTVALENLPDVAGDPSFGPDAVAECCADIGALRQLLSAPGGVNGVGASVQAYL